MSTPARPPLTTILLYALGQFGWSLASYGVGNLLTYFYLPPETGQGFPSFVYQGTVWGILTVVGLVSAGGRLLDALVDPWIAHWSDSRPAGRFGKRRYFLLLGALPLALFGWLVFQPVVQAENGYNILWMVVNVSLYYFFFAFYVIPYTALIAELGHEAKDRMLISTIISAAWALGFVAGNSTLAISSALESNGFAAVDAFQLALGILAAVAAVAMLVSALFLNEKKYAVQEHTEQPFKQAFQLVWQDKNYRQFLWSDLMYWLSLNFIQIGMAYYTTLLLGLDKRFVFNFSIISFLSSFLFYAPINGLTRRFGKKRLILLSFLIFAFLFAVLGFSNRLPLPAEGILYALAISAAFPLAVFGILPNALIGDAAVKREAGFVGLYYGIRAVVMKLGISLGNLIFPSLLQFGKSIENPLGVQITAWAALTFCLIGWLVFRRFEE